MIWEREVSMTALATLAIWAGSAVAAPVTTQSAMDFDYLWDFNGTSNTTNFDLYATTNGSLGSDGILEWDLPTSTAGGVVTLTNAPSRNQFWRTSAAVASQISAVTGYTVEYRVKATPVLTDLGGLTLESTLPSSSAVMTIQYKGVDVAAPDTSTLNIYWGFDETTLLTSVAANDFFTVRVAATPDTSKVGNLGFAIYLNDQLVIDGINAALTTQSVNRFFVGDIGSGDRGKLELDYVAFTPGAFAPVPEPTAAVVSFLGALTLMSRRPKR